MNTLPLVGQLELSTQVLLWALVLVAAGLLLTPKVQAWLAGIIGVVLGGLIIVLGTQWSTPLVTGTVLGAVGLMCLLPPSRNDLRIVGVAFFAFAIGFFAYAVASGQTAPATPDLVAWAVFIVLAMTTVGSAVAMVSSRNAVYCAIWFALAVLSTGGLFLYQGAQFLGVATVVVYAGAIVVTFLFVIMLAQPDGNAPYDRISWGWFAKPAAAIGAALLMGSVLYSLEAINVGGVREQVAATVEELNRSGESLPITARDVIEARFVDPQDRHDLELRLSSEAAELPPADKETLAAALAERFDIAPEAITLKQPLPPQHDVLADGHMAHLGGYLFSRHLIAVELAGTLLLAALVGAVAMLSQGPGRREGDARV